MSTTITYTETFTIQDINGNTVEFHFTHDDIAGGMTIEAFPVRGGEDEIEVITNPNDITRLIGWLNNIWKNPS